MQLYAAPLLFCGPRWAGGGGAGGALPGSLARLPASGGPGTAAGTQWAPGQHSETLGRASTEDLGLREVRLLSSAGCRESDNPTPSEKFGRGGSGGGAGKGGGFGGGNSPDARRPQSPPASVPPRPRNLLEGRGPA